MQLPRGSGRMGRLCIHCGLRSPLSTSTGSSALSERRALRVRAALEPRAEELRPFRAALGPSVRRVVRVDRPGPLTRHAGRVYRARGLALFFKLEGPRE